MNASYLDLVFIVILLICSIIACIRGFVKEIFKKGGPIVAIWVSILSFKRVKPLLEPYITNSLLQTLASFFSVFLVVFIALSIVQLIVGKLFKAPILSQLDHILGFVLGVIEGAAIVVFIVIILSSQPWFDVSKITDGSKFYEFISPLVSSQGKDLIKDMGTALISAL